MNRWERAKQNVDAVLDKAHRQQKPIGLNLSINSPAVLEILLDQQLDWLLIDQEHTLIQNISDLVNLLRCAEARNVLTLVKLPAWDPIRARDVLDAGAHGLMVPFVHTAEDLQNMLDVMRFPPHGQRGFCSVMRATHYSTASYSNNMPSVTSFVEFSNFRSLLVPTIESRQALENLDALLNIPDCPIWHVGLEDLSFALGDSSGPNIELAARAFKTIYDQLKARGKLLMAAIPPPTTTKPDLSWNDMPYIMDTECVGFGAQQIMRGMRG